MRSVIDASVAVKLFVPEELSTQARAIFARFASEDGARLLVPDFFFIECANVFCKWVQRFAYPRPEARTHLRDLTSLGFEVIPAEMLAEEALMIALAQKIAAYDACMLRSSSGKAYASFAYGGCEARSQT